MLRLAVFLGLLMLVVSTSVFLPAQAVRKDPWASCFEAVGRDPQGMSHAASFYHIQAAKKLAAGWIAEGWTGVMIYPC